MVHNLSALVTGIIVGVGLCLIVTGAFPRDDAVQGLHTRTGRVLAENVRSRSVVRVGASSAGVSSLLKDLGCGTRNTGMPAFLAVPNYGRERTMVDIGLFDGQETVAAVQVGFRVYAFEPLPSHMHMVISNFKKHRFVEGVDYQLVKLDASGSIKTPLLEPREGRGIAYLFAAAAGRAHEFRHIFPDRTGTSFVDSDPRKRIDSVTSVPVQIVPVSDYVHRDVDYFKSDTQGFDVNVLAGAQALFKRHHVRLVRVELFPQGLNGAGSSARELVEELTERLGFVCFSSMGETEQPRHLPRGHPEAKHEFLDLINASGESFQHRASKDRFGFFDDLTCVNPRMRARKAAEAEDKE